MADEPAGGKCGCGKTCCSYRLLVHQVVVGALFRASGEVLLCYRRADRKAYPAVWDFPFGHVETGENPLSALSRELLEEVGVAVRTATLSQRPDLHIRAEELDLSVWAVHSWGGEPVNRAPEEHESIRWVDVRRAITMGLAQSAYGPWLETVRRGISAE